MQGVEMVDMQDIETQRFDCIVVGSGPGGATVAKELTARGKKVLILEWGPAKPVKGSLWRYIMESLIPGKGMFLTSDLLGMVRGITLGGSSLFYYATAFPVPHEMLRKYGIDVRKEEEEARMELPIAPLKQEMITPMAARIMESARALGYNWKPLDKFMYQERWRPGFRFGYYGDPHRVKWSARMYVEEAVAGGAILIDRAKVKNVIMEGRRAVGVEFSRRGRTRRAFGSDIVIAAGGIGSPLILRNMGVTQAGYNLFFDPLITVCGKVKDVRKRKEEIPMTAGCIFKEDGFVMTDMPVPFLMDQVFTLSGFRPWRLFESRKTLRIMIKIRDDLAGRLSRRGWVVKKLTPADKEKLRKGYEIAANILHHAGARGIYKTWKLAAHPGGTVRIGHILDSNLKVMGYENCYVCDCSVIPEPWGLPPVLTLVCLGKRLAKSLAGGGAGRRGARKAGRRKRAGR